MSQEFAERVWESTMENVGLYLLGLSIGDGCENSIQTCHSQDLLHLRIKDTSGEVAVQVCGKDLDEVASQVVLGCLQRISIQQLRDLHKKPLKKPLELCQPRK
jgi:hypothetical protein